jgi:hypothetical protein
VFDPDSKIARPLSGEHLELENHDPKRGIYFGLYADPEYPRTTEQGLFSFFNVDPAHRYLLRPENNKPLYRLNVRKNSAYYIEFGKQGKTNLKAKVVDAKEEDELEASVRFVGEKEFKIHTDEEGEFTIPDLDFPKGEAVVEVYSSHYPLTWFNLEVDPRKKIDPDNIPTLSLLKSSYLKKIAEKIPGFKRNRHAGILVLNNEDKSLHPVLVSKNSKYIDKKYGPFLMKKPYYGFVYFNLPPDPYSIQWTDRRGNIKRFSTADVGMNRLTIGY